MSEREKILRLSEARPFKYFSERRGFLAKVALAADFLLLLFLYIDFSNEIFFSYIKKSAVYGHRRQRPVKIASFL